MFLRRFGLNIFICLQADHLTFSDAWKVLWLCHGVGSPWDTGDTPTLEYPHSSGKSLHKTLCLRSGICALGLTQWSQTLLAGGGLCPLPPQCCWQGANWVLQRVGGQGHWLVGDPGARPQQGLPAAQPGVVAGGICPAAARPGAAAA